MTAHRAIHLATFTDADYAEFTSLQVAEYANQLVRAGEVAPDEGIATARERLIDLLEDRLRMAGDVFFVAMSAREGFRVGWVWVSPAPAFLGSSHGCSRWLSQLTVEVAHRDRAWGRAVLLATEQHLASTGVEQLWLRVFDWNVVARRLYASLGYELVQQFPADAHLRKRLSRTE